MQNYWTFYTNLSFEEVFLISDAIFAISSNNKGHREYYTRGYSQNDHLFWDKTSLQINHLL